MIPFFLFLFGTFEYCRYLLVLHTATNAAREGARYASVNVTNPDVTGTPVTAAPYSAAAPAFAVPAIVDRVTGRMAGVENQIAGYAVRVFPCDSAQLYADPPGFAPRAGATAWNNASFGERIAVRITGIYEPLLPNFLMMGSQIPIDLTVTMGSEG